MHMVHAHKYAFGISVLIIACTTCYVCTCTVISTELIRNYVSEGNHLLRYRNFAILRRRNTRYKKPQLNCRATLFRCLFLVDVSRCFQRKIFSEKRPPYLFTFGYTRTRTLAWTFKFVLANQMRV